MEWRNRIIGYGMEDPEQLLANPRNWRIHTALQEEALVEVLDDIGWVDDIMVNQATSFVVDGHLRVAAAIRTHQKAIPVKYVELTDEEEAKILASFDPIAGMAGIDRDKVAELVEGLNFRSEGLGDLIKGLLPRVTENIPADADRPAGPAQQRVEPGDIWAIGEHRLMCGDATDPIDVGLLLDGAVPHMMITDPPYGVNYDPLWRKNMGLNNSDRLGLVQNDDRVDWTPAWTLFPGAVAYIWHSGVFAAEVAGSIHTAGLEIRSQIIWYKTRFAISRGHYHWQHEPCWYAVRKGAKSRWVGDRAQSTIWEIMPVVSGEKNEDETPHGTQKPVECMLRPMRNHGAAGDAVYDPFVGSGTTLVAAELAGRRCYAMDIEPHWCDVAMTRLETFSKQAASLLRRKEGRDASFSSSAGRTESEGT